MNNPFEDEITEKHPSFVTVSFHRISGQRRFFGSSVTSQTWIELKISSATLRHHLGQDWIHDSTQTLIEVALSPAQFAELLTTMNSGPGVPGTLQRFDGKKVDQLPEIKSETHRVREHFKKTMKSRSVEFRESFNEIKALLDEKKTLGKADREKVLSTLDQVASQFENSAPFYLEQFEEAAERIAVQAKAEVDAFVTHAIQTTGIKALRSGMTPELLNSTEETSDQTKRNTE